MHEVYKTVLPGELVFDIGAHEGNKSAIFAGRFCRVVAVEPQPKLAHALRERFIDNPRVQVKEMGVASKLGSQEMFISSNNSVLSTFSKDWMSGRFRNYKWDDRATIEMTTLDLLIEAHGVPRYIKVDAEGLELDIINGLTQKNPLLSFEFTSEYLDIGLEVVNRLHRKGYEYFNFSVSEQSSLALPIWATPQDLSVALMQQRLADSDLWGDIYAA